MRQRPDTVMIFAAGLGRRMLPLTLTRPKPLIKVAGRALIDHALALAKDAGITKVVVNLHHFADQLADHLAGQGVTLIHEEQLLETGGGLKNALPWLGSAPVLVLNSDAVWTGPNPLTALIDAFDDTQMEALLAISPIDKVAGHPGTGDFAMDANNRLTWQGPQVYLGAHVTRTDHLAQVAQKEFSVKLLWEGMIARRGLFGLTHQGGWCDVGQPESIAIAEAMLARAAHV